MPRAAGLYHARKCFGRRYKVAAISLEQAAQTYAFDQGKGACGVLDRATRALVPHGQQRLGGRGANPAPFQTVALGRCGLLVCPDLKYAIRKRLAAIQIVLPHVYISGPRQGARVRL